MKENKTLLSLNVANNNLDQATGKFIREVMMENKTLIHLDISMNEFDVDDSLAIHDYLDRNVEIYQAEKIKEWKERKGMR